MLVTGAAGFAGSHVVDMLARDGVRVTGWHRPGGATPRPSMPDVSWDPVDLLDRHATAEAIRRLRPAAVYHCAGAAHVGRAWDSTTTALAINVRGTHHLLDALASAKVPARVLITGSALVYRAADRALTEDDALVPATPYGLSKLAQEMLAGRHDVVAAGIEVMVARSFNHIGPRQDPYFAASGFARRIADIEAGRWAPELTVGNLDARREVTDVRDTVRAYRAIVERGQPGRAYNVCSGHAISIRDLLDRLLARARARIEVRVDPARLRPNDTPLLTGDPRRLRDELGWSPLISLDQTLDDLLGYWRGQPA